MRRQVCAALIVVAASLTGAQVTRPDLARLLATRVTNYPVKAANLLEAVAQISSEFNIPVGIEWNHAPTAQRIITGEWTGTTVGQVLSEVVAEDPAYELGISNGVVHVRPRGFARNPANFLNITLASFTAKDQYTQTIGFALRDRLNETFTRKPPPAAACAGSTGIGADERLTSLSLRNVTVGNVLDALLVRSRYSMWLVTFDPARSYNGFLDTNSLWRKITEQDQPNWDYVSRYFDPVQLKRRADWIFWKPAGN